MLVVSPCLTAVSPAQPARIFASNAFTHLISALSCCGYVRTTRAPARRRLMSYLLRADQHVRCSWQQRMRRMRQVLNHAKLCCCCFSLFVSARCTLFSALGMAGWLRDLTAEGVEANPGPALCQHAGCDCAMSRKELTESKENDGYDLQLNGSCPGCTHLVSAHQKEALVAAAAPSAAGQCVIQTHRARS